MPTPSSSFLGRGPRRLMWAAAFLVTLVVAAHLRLDGLGEPSLWLDEILHLEKARDAADAPWQDWLTGVSVDRENGSLYYASQLLALRLFDGEFAVRLIPALAGLATIGAIFLVALSATNNGKVNNGKVATVVAALLATSPLHVYYSREGRPYAAVMLAATLLLLVALEYRRPRARGAIYGLCVVNIHWGAVVAPVLISCAVLAALNWLRHRRNGHFVAAALLGLMIGWLLFPNVHPPDGANRNIAQWEITEPLSRLAFDRLLASFSVSGVDRGSSTGLSFLLLSLALWGGACLARRDLYKAVWVGGMCLLPIAGSLAVLVAWEHWYNVRYTSAGLPAFLVLVGIGLVDMWDRFWRLALRRTAGERFPSVTDTLLPIFLLLLLAPAWRSARAEPFEKPDWRGVAKLIGGLAVPGEPVLTRDPWSDTCIRHYLHRLNLPTEVFSTNHDVARARHLTERYPRAWVLAAGYRKTVDFQAWTHDLDPVFSNRLANLQLFFFPSFASFLSTPNRSDRLAFVLAEKREPAARQEFTQSELLLGTGWSYPERNEEGMSFRWATADRAEIAIPASSERSGRVLRLRMNPFPSPDRPAQSVEVTVNSRWLTKITLEPGWNEVSLPPFYGHRAVDLVSFHFAWRQSSRELNPDSPDSRQLAVAFDFVEAINSPPTSLTGSAN